MNLGSLKTLLEIIEKLFTYCRRHKIVNLVQTGVLAMAFYMAFSVYFWQNRHADNADKAIIINEKISDVVKSCGVGSYVTWLVIKEGELDLNNSSAVVRDIVGCQSEREYHCPASVKFLNNIYSEKFDLSLNDIGIIRNTPSNSIISCNIISNRLKCPNGTPNLLESIQEKLKLPISRLSYVLVKDFKNKTIYAFSLSFTIAASPICSEQIGNTLLESLARTAEINL